MANTERIEISINKNKLIKNLISSIVFVLLGLWILIYQPSVSNSLLNGPVVKYGISILCILFFGFAAYSFLKKLIDKKPGFIIDINGIIDNSSAVASGYVPWHDITQIVTARVMKQEFLMLIVKNPEEYLSRQKNPLKRQTMKMNFKKYGSPISISGNTLNCTLDELKAILERRIQAGHA